MTGQTDAIDGDRPAPPREELLAARWLAWIGGAATVLGICLLLVLAISHGWIGPRLGLVLTAAAGAVVTAAAVRWDSRTLGALGMLVPLIVPWVLPPGSDLLDLPLLLLVTSAIVYMAHRQTWGWHACAAIVLAEIDAGIWMASQPTIDVISAGAIVPFTVIGIATAAALQWDAPAGERSRPAVAILILGALATLLSETFVSSATDGLQLVSPMSVTAGLLAFAGVHLGLGIVALHPRNSHATAAGATPLEPLASTAFALATVLVDLALAACLHGLPLTLGWGASALAIAALRRHRAGRPTDQTLVDIGLAGHIALVLVRALVSAPPAALVAGPVTPAGVIAVALLAAICLVSVRTAPDGAEFLPTVIAGLGLLSIAYLTAITISGPALVAAWGAEAAALAALHRRDRDWITALGAIGFLAGAWAHALILEAPPWALLTGAASIPAAALALGSAAVATETIRRLAIAGRVSLLPLVALAPLYGVSVAIITVFQPAVGAGLDLLDLTVRQQGQVLISALWTVSGLASLIVGLRRNLPGWRHGGLALLLLSAAKVFLYDLATLTSVYRVVSFIVLGLLLLSGALAYERLRPAR